MSANARAAIVPTKGHRTREPHPPGKGGEKKNIKTQPSKSAAMVFKVEKSLCAHLPRGEQRQEVLTGFFVVVVGGGEVGGATGR